MTDNVAVLQGYTKELYIEHSTCSLNVLVKPETDTQDRFKAWCMDEQEFININGWQADQITEC